MAHCSSRTTSNRTAIILRSQENPFAQPNQIALCTAVQIRSSFRYNVEAPRFMMANQGLGTGWYGVGSADSSRTSLVSNPYQDLRNSATCSCKPHKLYVHVCQNTEDVHTVWDDALTVAGTTSWMLMRAKYIPLGWKATIINQ
jgi:hypothetical protein